LDEIEKRVTKKSKQEQLAVDVSAIPPTPESSSKKMQASSEPLLSNPRRNLPTSKVSSAKNLKGPRNDMEMKDASPPMYKDEQEEGRQDEDAGESSDDEHTMAPLVHETVINSGTTSSVATRSHLVYVPHGEMKEQREARTVFIGNVPMEVAKSRVNYSTHCMDLKLILYQPYQKALKRHLLALCITPTSDGLSPKIECIRFRSVAFKIPTTKLPADGDKPNGKSSEHRQRDRAITWKSMNEKNDEGLDPAKTYLTPAQKKKVAFIKGELHEEAGSINCYVVFAHPQPINQRDEKKGPRYQAVMDPFEAAKLLVARGDGSTFMNRTLRVDFVRSPEEGNAAAHGFDPHITIFVGSLDFKAHEEDLHAYFESVMVAEQGPPPEDIKSWVQGVRVIRDQDTQLGKGFAYVKFAVGRG
jgi:nucleolar protein 12